MSFENKFMNSSFSQEFKEKFSAYSIESLGDLLKKDYCILVEAISCLCREENCSDYLKEQFIARVIKDISQKKGENAFSLLEIFQVCSSDQQIKSVFSSLLRNDNDITVLCITALKNQQKWVNNHQDIVRELVISCSSFIGDKTMHEQLSSLCLQIPAVGLFRKENEKVVGRLINEACQEGDISMLESLLEQGISINTKIPTLISGCFVSVEESILRSYDPKLIEVGFKYGMKPDKSVFEWLLAKYSEKNATQKDQNQVLKSAHICIVNNVPFSPTKSTSPSSDSYYRSSIFDSGNSSNQYASDKILKFQEFHLKTMMSNELKMTDSVLDKIDSWVEVMGFQLESWVKDNPERAYQFLLQEGSHLKVEHVNRLLSVLSSNSLLTKERQEALGISYVKKDKKLRLKALQKYGFDIQKLRFDGKEDIKTYAIKKGKFNVLHGLIGLGTMLTPGQFAELCSVQIKEKEKLKKLVESLVDKGFSLEGVHDPELIDSVWKFLISIKKKEHVPLISTLMNIGLSASYVNEYGEDLLQIFLKEVEESVKSSHFQDEKFETLNFSSTRFSASCKKEMKKGANRSLGSVEKYRVAKLLLEKRKKEIDIDHRNKNGETVLSHLIGNLQDEYCDPLSDKKKNEMIRILLDHGADINIQFQNGETLLHRAVKMGNQQWVNYLVRLGADVTIADSNGKTPCELGKTDKQVFELLKKSKTHPDNKTDYYTDVLRKTDERTLGHVLGDSFLEGMKDDKKKDLEGNSFFSSISYFNSLLSFYESKPSKSIFFQQPYEQDNAYKRARKNLGDLEKLVEELDRSDKDSSLLERVKHRIKAMDEGNSLLLPSGWTSDQLGGHAMLCEVRCMGKGKYELFLYNTGDGSHFHTFLPTSSKIYRNSTLHFKDISQEDLVKSNFIESLFELRTLDERKNRGFSANDIYLAVFSRFKTPEVVSSERCDYITPQRSGTCSMMVLQAYLRAHMERKEYKKIHYELRKIVLEIARKKYGNSLKGQHSLRKILREGVRVVAKELLKFHLASIDVANDCELALVSSNFFDVLKRGDILESKEANKEDFEGFTSEHYAVYEALRKKHDIPWNPKLILMLSENLSVKPGTPLIEALDIDHLANELQFFHEYSEFIKNVTPEEKVIKHPFSNEKIKHFSTDALVSEIHASGKRRFMIQKAPSSSLRPEFCSITFPDKPAVNSSTKVSEIEHYFEELYQVLINIQYTDLQDSEIDHLQKIWEQRRIQKDFFLRRMSSCSLGEKNDFEKLIKKLNDIEALWNAIRQGERSVLIIQEDIDREKLETEMVALPIFKDRGVNNCVSEVAKYLENLDESLQSLIQTNNGVIAEEINKAFLSIPLFSDEFGSDSWKDMNLEDCQQLMETVNNILARNISVMMSSSSKVHAENIVGLSTIFALSYLLSVNIEEKIDSEHSRSHSIRDFMIDTSVLENALDHSMSPIFDQKVKVKSEEVRSFFDRVNDKNKGRSKLFDFCSFTGDGKRYLSLPIPHKSAEYLYYVEEAQKNLQKYKLGYLLKGVSRLDWAIAQLVTGVPHSVKHFTQLQNVAFALFIASSYDSNTHKQWKLSDNESLMKVFVQQKSGGWNSYSNEEEAILTSALAGDKIPVSLGKNLEEFGKNLGKLKSALEPIDKSENDLAINVDKEGQNLYSISLKKELMVPHWIQYISEYPLKLQRQHIRDFLELMLFRGGRLDEEFISYPYRIDQLFSAVDTSINKLMMMFSEKKKYDGIEKSEEHQALLYMMHIKCRILHVVKHLEDQGKIEKQVVDVEKELDNLRSFYTDAISSENSLEARYLLASYLYFSPKNPSEANDFINVHTMVSTDDQKHSEAEKKATNDHLTLTHDIHRSTSEQLYKSFEMIGEEATQKHLNAFCNKYYGIPPVKKWEISFPVAKAIIDKKLYQIDLNTWSVFCDGLSLSNHDKLFKDENFVFIYDNDEPKGILCENISSQYVKYTFYDNRGALVNAIGQARDQFASERTPLWFTKSFEGKRYQFIPWSELTDANGESTFICLPKIPNNEHYILWKCIEGDREHFRIEDCYTHEVYGIIDADGLLHEEGEERYVVDITKDPGLSALKDFENSSKILVTKVAKGVSENSIRIRFPRYTYSEHPLSFSSRLGMEQNGLFFDQETDTTIDIDQSLKGFTHFNKYLITKNSKGERRLFVPIQDYNGLFGGIAIENSYECLSIPVDANGELSPKNIKQSLFCAYLYLLDGNEAKSHMFLEQSTKIGRYNHKELKFLGWIYTSKFQTGNHHPNAQAIQLHAAWLAQKNLFRYPKKKLIGEPKLGKQHRTKINWDQFFEGKEEFNNRKVYEMLREDYTSYLSVRHNVLRDLRIHSAENPDVITLLDRGEEVLWLMNMNKLRSPQISERLLYLYKGRRTSFTTYYPENTFPEIKAEMPDLLNLWKEKSKKTIIDFSSRLRPEESFKQQFFNLLEVAENGKPSEKKRLKLTLADMRFDPDPHNQALRILLESILTKFLGYQQIYEELIKSEGRSLQNLSGLRVELNQFISSYIQNQQITTPSEYSTELLKDLEHVNRLPMAKFSSEKPSNNLSVSIDQKILSEKRNQIGKDKKWIGTKVKIKDHLELELLPSKSKFSKMRRESVLKDYKLGCEQNDEAIKKYFLEGTLEDQKLWMREIKKNEQILSKDLKGHEREMIKWLSYEPIDRKASAVQQLQYLSGANRKATIRDLTIAFLQGNVKAYRRLNKHLPLHVIESLHDTMGLYLFQKNHYRYQKKKRELLAIILSENSSKEDQKQSIDKLGFLIDMATYYDPEEWFRLMVFEDGMDLFVWPEQIESVKQMVGPGSGGEKGEKFPQLVLQKMMGSGKTLVYGTLMSLLKADGEHLSILIPPSTLYYTNAQGLKSRAEKLFGQKADTILFTRNIDQFEENYLLDIYNRLISAIENRDVMILPPDSLRAMQNKYLEMRDQLIPLYAHKEANQKEIDAIEAPLKVLKSILILMKERGIFTFDEIDVTLRSNKELNFPVGHEMLLNPYTNELLKELALIAITDRDVINKGLLLKENRQAEFSDEKYPDVKSSLATKLFSKIIRSDKWCSLFCINKRLIDPFVNSEGFDSKRILNRFLERKPSILSNEELEVLYQKKRGVFTEEDIHLMDIQRGGGIEPYLQEINTYICLKQLDEAYQYITNSDLDLPYFIEMHEQSGNKQRVEAANWYVLLRMELTSWLQSSLRSSAGQHYDFSFKNPKKETGIPSEYGTPCELSEFADEFVMIMRTLHLYAWKPLKLEQVKLLGKQLKTKAFSEWKEQGCSSNLLSLPMVGAFYQVTNKNLFQIDLEDTQVLCEIQKSLFENTEEALNLVYHYVIPNVLNKETLHQEQIYNNGHNLASMPKKKQGYTGTIENEMTLPEDMEVIPEVGTKGKIIDHLISQKTRVDTIKDDNLEETLLHMIHLGTEASKDGTTFQNIIDIGSQFRGYDSLFVAEKLKTVLIQSGKQRFKGILTWDDQKKQLVCLKIDSAIPGSHTIVSIPQEDPETIERLTGFTMDQLFVFYPHHKLTGADLKLPENARALCTFSPKVPLRDILQGVMRMRKLFHQQRVQFCLTEGTEKVIRESFENDSKHLEIMSVIAFAENNETIVLEGELVHSLMQKLNNAVRNYVLQQLYAVVDDGAKENELYIHFRHIFVRKLRKSLVDQYGRTPCDISMGDFIDRYIQSMIEFFIDTPFSSMFDEKGELKKHCPKEVIELFKNMKAIVNGMKEFLPETVSTHALLDLTREATVEQQVEEIAEQTIEDQKLVEEQVDVIEEIDDRKREAIEKEWTTPQLLNMGIHSEIITNYPNTNENHPTFWRLNDVIANDPYLFPYQGCFSDDVLVTENFVKTTEGGHKSNLLEKIQKRLREVLIIENSSLNRASMVFVSAKEAAFFKALKDADAPILSKMRLLSPKGDLVKTWAPLTEGDDQTVDQLILQSLFFTGNVEALGSNKWLPFFKEWSMKNSQLLKNLFEVVIIGGDEDKQIAYEASMVEKALNEYALPDDGSSGSKGELLSEWLRLAALSVVTENTEEAVKLLNQLIDSKSDLSSAMLSKCIGLACRVIKSSRGCKGKRQLLTLLSETIDPIKRGDTVAIEGVGPQLKGILDVDIATQVQQIAQVLIQTNNHDLIIELISNALIHKSVDFSGVKNKETPLLLRNILFRTVTQLHPEHHKKVVNDLYNVFKSAYSPYSQEEASNSNFIRKVVLEGNGHVCNLDQFAGCAFSSDLSVLKSDIIDSLNGNVFNKPKMTIEETINKLHDEYFSWTDQLPVFHKEIVSCYQKYIEYIFPDVREVPSFESTDFELFIAKNVQGVDYDKIINLLCVKDPYLNKNLLKILIGIRCTPYWRDKLGVRLREQLNNFILESDEYRFSTD